MASAPTAAAGTKYVVARADEVPEGARLLVNVQGRAVGIFHVEGRFYALLNRCPHQGGPLCKGAVLGLLESDRPGEYRFFADKKLITCPWHGWEFDMENGQSYFDPRKMRARPYKVSVEQGKILAQEIEQHGADSVGELVKGPYVADVIPISVEDDYLVVTMGTPGAPGV